MNSSLAKSLRAGAMILAMASPVWAEEAMKRASAQEQERKGRTRSIEGVIKVQEALDAKGQDPGDSMAS
jgi:BioD-like phosphotransacetylase family protein